MENPLNPENNETPKLCPSIYLEKLSDQIEIYNLFLGWKDHPLDKAFFDAHKRTCQGYMERILFCALGEEMAIYQRKLYLDFPTEPIESFEEENPAYYRCKMY